MKKKNNGDYVHIPRTFRSVETPVGARTCRVEEKNNRKNIGNYKLHANCSDTSQSNIHAHIQLCTRNNPYNSQARLPSALGNPSSWKKGHRGYKTTQVPGKNSSRTFKAFIGFFPRYRVNEKEAFAQI
ncbi:hypothetical protein CBL_11631 [Carabus blaptoides fortunei]